MTSADTLLAQRRYSAFVSYRHADNIHEGRRWAEWLHRALERYVVPPDLIGTPNLRGEPIRDSLYPIFRDEDELPANADLATGIRSALEASDYLIVLCSPRSAVSPWVRKEVRDFKELGRSDRILAIIIAGEPNADDPAKAREGIMRDEECFCEELRLGVRCNDGSIDWTARTEPLAADLRPGGVRAEGFVTAEAYREHLALNSSLPTDKIISLVEAYRQRIDQALLKVIAGLLGVALGTLVNRDAAYLATLAEAKAERQRQIAERERQLAEQAKRSAEEAHRSRLATERIARRLAIAGASALLLALLTAWFWWQAGKEKTEAEKQRTVAQTALAESDYEHSERLFEQDDGASAVWYLSRAVATGAASPGAGKRLWAALAQRSWPIPLSESAPAAGEILVSTFDPRGDRFAAATKTGQVLIYSSVDGRLLTETSVHRKAVRGVRFSPDGRRLLTGSDDSTAKLWDMSTPVMKLEGTALHEGMVAAIAWSADSLFYATGSSDKFVRVWSVSRPEEPVFKTQMKDKVHTLQFDPHDSSRILAVAKDEASIWKLGCKEPLFGYHSHADLDGAQFCTGGTKVISFTNEGEVVVSDVVKRLEHWAEQYLGSACDQCEVSPDGSIAAFVSNAQLMVYAIEQPLRNLWTIPLPDLITRIKFTSEGRRLVAARADGRVEIFSVADHRRVSEPILGPGVPTGLDVHPEGDRILTTWSTRVVRLWSLSPPQPQPVAACTLEAPPVSLAASGAAVLGISENGKTFIASWDRTAGKIEIAVAGTSPGTLLTSAAYEPAAGVFVAGSYDGRLFAISPLGGPVRKLGQLPSLVTQVAFNPKGWLLGVGCEDGSLATMEWPDKSPPKEGAPHLDKVSGIAFLEPGGQLLSAGWDKRLLLSSPDNPAAGDGQWALAAEPTAFAVAASGKCAVIALGNGDIWFAQGSHNQCRKLSRKAGGPPSCVAVTSNGDLIAIGTVTGLLDIMTPEQEGKSTRIKCGNAGVSSVTFDSIGRCIATGTEDGIARLWDSQTGKPLTESLACRAAVRGIVFNADNSIVASGSIDGSFLFWRSGPLNADREIDLIAKLICSQGGAEKRFVLNGNVLEHFQSIVPQK